jgi:hypothetical protein
MRKKLSIMLATIMVLTLMASGPVAAVNGEPTVTVCILEEFTVPPDLEFVPGTTEVTESVASFLFVHEAAAPGPCPEGDGGGVGGGVGGGGSGGGAAAPLELTQETEQEAESGDVDQSFEVTGGGDNSNQCASPQGVANTGNPQNVIDLLQAASETDDYEFEEVGSDITVDGTNETTCDQQVNQAASASG